MQGLQALEESVQFLELALTLRALWEGWMRKALSQHWLGSLPPPKTSLAAWGILTLPPSPAHEPTAAPGSHPLVLASRLAPQSTLSPDHTSPPLPAHRPRQPLLCSPASVCISLSRASITAPSSRNLMPKRTPSLALPPQAPPCGGTQDLCQESQPCAQLYGLEAQAPAFSVSLRLWG